jgi:hypothetical protein
LVKASSAGLKDATIKLRFIGDRPFPEGRGAGGRIRPYVRFEKKNQPKIETTFGPNNPTFASSSATDAAPGLAADANPETAWKAAASDTDPAIILDTEKGLSISRIQLDFPGKKIRRYRVEVSNDRSNWTSVVDLTGNTEANGSKVIPTPGGTKGRYVRVAFAKADEAALSEIRVTGTILD